MPNKTLVVTTTITPEKDVYILELKDADTRLFQLLSSLVAWIRYTSVPRILLCENSGHPYDFQAVRALAGEHGKAFEFLKCPPCPEVIQYGKGFGEGRMLEYALNQSGMLREDDTFYKITGRFFIRNFEEIQKRYAGVENVFGYHQGPLFSDKPVFLRKILYLLRGPQDFLLNLKTLKYRPLKFLLTPQGTIDCRFFKCKVAYYKKVLGQAYRKVNDRSGYYLEHLYHDHLAKRKDYTIFTQPPEFVGQSASLGVWDSAYEEDIQQTARRLMRA